MERGENDSFGNYFSDICKSSTGRCDADKELNSFLAEGIFMQQLVS